MFNHFNNVLSIRSTVRTSSATLLWKGRRTKIEESWHIGSARIPIAAEEQAGAFGQGSKDDGDRAATVGVSYGY